MTDGATTTVIKYAENAIIGDNFGGVELSLKNTMYVN
jgi:hypothetical protein